MTTPSLHQQEKLEALGWNDFFAEQALAYPGLLPARVSRPDLNRYHLLAASGPLTGLLPGRARSAGQTKAELPTVGDWVLVSYPAAQAADTGD